MDAGLPGVEFETHGRIASAVREARGNRAFFTKNRSNFARSAPLSLSWRGKSDRLLVGGVPGVAPAKVVVIGGGVSGTQAARMALGLGADVTVLDIQLARLCYLDDVYGAALKTRYSEAVAIDELARAADLVVGAVLIPGKQAPKLLKHTTVEKMKGGSVFVDIAIDQGGCAETSRPTSHSEPTYIESGVVHYCVTNMPATCARTAPWR